MKADYTEDARRQNIEGEVVLEIVVRRDGSVSDIKLISGLPGGLNDRAIAAGPPMAVLSGHAAKASPWMSSWKSRSNSSLSAE